MRIALALQVFGLLAIAAGGFLLWPWLGLILLGAGALAFGIAIERGGE